jgi:hypothetical protein
MKSHPLDWLENIANVHSEGKGKSRSLFSSAEEFQVGRFCGHWVRRTIGFAYKENWSDSGLMSLASQQKKRKPRSWASGKQPPKTVTPHGQRHNSRSTLPPQGKVNVIGRNLQQMFLLRPSRPNPLAKRKSVAAKWGSLTGFLR